MATGGDIENINKMKSKINREAVFHAITELNEKTGSSIQAITKYLKNNNDYDNRTEKDINNTIKRILKAGLKDGIFESKTNGVNSRVKISKNAQKQKKNKSKSKNKNPSSENNESNNVEPKKEISKTKRKLFNVEEISVPKKIKKLSSKAKNEKQAKQKEQLEQSVKGDKNKSATNREEKNSPKKKQKNVSAKGNSTKKSVKDKKSKISKGRKSLSKAELERIRKSTVVRVPAVGKKDTKKQKKVV